MKKFLQAALCLVALCLTTSSASAQCCTSFTDGPYTNLNPVPCADNCEVPVVTGFQVWSNEAYVVEGIVAGTTYTISLVDAVENGNVLTAGVWPAEITVGYANGTGATTIFDTTLPSVCSTNYTLNFTAPIDGNILVLINEVGNCNALNSNNIDNGHLSLAVDCATAPACAPLTCNAGNVALLDAQIVCLDGNITLTTDGTEDLSLSVNPTYGWGFYDAVTFDLISFVTFGADPASYNLVDIPYNLLLGANGIATIPAGDYIVYGIVADDKGTAEDTADDEFCFTTDPEYVTFLDAADPACFCAPGDVNPLVAATPQTIDACGTVQLFTDGTEDLSGNVNGMYYWAWFDATTGDFTYLMPSTDLNTCDIPAGTYEVNGVVIDDKNTPEDTADDVVCFTANFATVTVNAVAPQCGALASTDLTSVVDASGATLSWAAVPNAQAYQLAGRKQGGATKVFPETQNTTRTFPAAALQPSTTYQWSVRVKCDGVWTDYALPPASFTTPAGKNNINTTDIFATEEEEATPFATKMYPNPAKDMLHIEYLSFDTAEKVNFTISDIAGRQVWQGSLQNGTNEINISTWNEGIYFVQIASQNHTATQKLVVAR